MSRPALLFCFSVDIVGFVLGVDNLLTAVETVIAGDHITESDGEKEVRRALKTEQLKADQKRCDGAVGHAAEECAHADGSTQGRRKPEQIAELRAEGCADEKGGNNLTALVSAAERQCGKQNFEEECRGMHIPVDTLLNHGRAGSVVGLIADDERQKQHTAAAGKSADIRIL